MKKYSHIGIICTVISMAFSGSTFAVNLQKITLVEAKISKASTTHKMDQSISLQETLNKITTASGISFIVDTDISNDEATYVDTTIDINSTIKSLLAEYNWVGIQDKNTLKTVIIIGKNRNHTMLTPDVDSKANNSFDYLSVNNDNNRVMSETCNSCKPDQSKIIKNDN